MPLVPSRSVVPPLTVLNPGCVCASSEAWLRPFCSLDCCPTCPRGSSVTRAQLGPGWAAKLALANWPHAPCNLFVSLPNLFQALVGTGFFTGVFSTLHSQHKPLRTRSHFFCVLHRARGALHFPTKEDRRNNRTFTCQRQ